MSAGTPGHVTPLDARRAADWLVAVLRDDTRRAAQLDHEGPIRAPAVFLALSSAYPQTVLEPDTAADRLDALASLTDTAWQRLAAQYASARLRLDSDCPPEPEPAALVAALGAAFDDPADAVLDRATDYALLMWEAAADAL